MAGARHVAATAERLATWRRLMSERTGFTDADPHQQTFTAPRGASTTPGTRPLRQSSCPSE